jgi:alkaline phosphatase
VVFGGGFRHLIPSGVTYKTTYGDIWSGKRTDDDNLYEELLGRGYDFVDNKRDMMALKKYPAWGLFDDSHMQPDIDRQYFATHEPSLAEMVSKAIDLLSRDKDGFFLMVEGPQIDWAGHNNDPIYMTTDFLAFDDAVKVACDFADKNGQTLVLAFPDHNTGGMKIGHYHMAMHYTETKIEDLVNPLKGMRITSAGLNKKMKGDYSIDNIIDKVAEYWSLNIDKAEAREILDYKDKAGVSFNYALAHVISKYHTVIGWTSHGHNGETVPVWVYGGEAPVGLIDNTELAKIAADAMGVNLSETTKRLYVDLDVVTKDYEIAGDPTIGRYGLLKNLVLNLKGAELPISKDTMLYKGHTTKLPGVTIYAPATKKVYVSREALRIIGLQ